MDRRKERIRQARLKRVIKEFEEVVLPALAEKWERRPDNRLRSQLASQTDELKRKLRGESE